MFESIKRILTVFADNELFEEGVELIGSWCFSLYQQHLGAKEFPLMTQDIDFLIPSPFHGKEHLGFIKQLEDLGFQPDFKRDGSLFLWNSELKIEFITTEKGAGTDKAIKIKKLGIDAIPLRHVGFLLEDPITIIDKGIKITVPAPERFCLQKLIIAPRRRKIEKRLKDIQQAVCTSVIVDSKEIRDLFRSLPAKWRRDVLRMLEVAKTELPLLREDVEKLVLTLQHDK
ncbi:MAG TPA: GSU2403 family nucleotidyltransferase fold protein [Candidatus Omnitrophota bacterium]|nr:GSU2403 family nucleotidyltransferase fold protein [Candidatus Omnitrophota bacterium]HRZ14773.1 GSU2403 family nucleotidyltransferase fold protein [Candidatus Omnitrophota bacterium]